MKPFVETRALRAAAAALVVLLVVSSCGGGGGGGGSSSSSGGSSSGGGLSFTLDRNAISFDYLDTSGPPAEFVVATAHGTLPGTLFIGAQDQATYLNPQIVATLSATQGTFSILPRANLAVGTYSGTLNLLACSDQNCSRHLGNSPMPVSYTIRVRPGLRIMPEPTQTPISYVSGQEEIVSYTVQLPENATAATVATINGGGICRIGNATPTSFRLIASSVPARDYLCQFSVEAGGRIQLYSVFFLVTVPAGGQHDLSVQETGLTLTTVEGAPSAPQRLHVTTSTWDSQVGIAVSGYGGNASGWLTFTRTNDGFDVVADASSLSEGNYFASIRVYGQSPHFAQEVIIPVSVTVGPGLVRPADVLRAVTSESVLADLSGSVPINIAGGPVVSWSATSNQSWLVLTTSSGQTGANLAYTYNNAAFRALTNGRQHEASITVTAANPAIAPVTFAVRVSKRLAQVSGLGPYLHVSGGAVHAYVRGVGFNSVANLSRLQVAGIANATFTPVNDTTLMLDIPAPVGAGAFRVSATNALGYTVQSRSLVIIDPVSIPYATASTGLPVGNVIYDVERQTAYVSGRGPSVDRVYRYQRNGANWIRSMRPAGEDYNIGMSNDGTQLVMTESPSTIRMLDPTTFADVAEFNSPTLRFQAGPLNGRKVAITNDGRIWLGPNNQLFSRDLTVFDPLDNTFSSFTLPGTLSLDTATLEVPRDGAHVFIGERFGSSYFTSILDAVTSTFTSVPNITSVNLFVWHSSDNGGRLTVGGSLIYDRELQRYANVYEALRLRNDWIQAVIVMKPDGTRGYVLTYDPTDINHTNTPTPAAHSHPRVYVVDTSAAQGTPGTPGNPGDPGTAIIKGYFEINDYPMCRERFGCDQQDRGEISPDGRTLFFAGSDRLVITPIPAETTLVTVGNLPPPILKRWTH